MNQEAGKLPQFALIKQFISGHIESGAWPAGTLTPSENELSNTFSVSRMTARRALQELSYQGLLRRTPGLGTFVADPAPPVTSVEVTNIVDQAIKAGTHSSRLLTLEATTATQIISGLLHLPFAQTIYHCVVVHLNKNNPIQWQALYVNPHLAPAFLKQNYARVTPDAYLNWVSTVSSIDHQVEAVLPSAIQRRELGFTRDDAVACLQVNRRCWSQQAVRSYSMLVHPASCLILGSELNSGGLPQ